jgi:hypothetical protein
VSANGGYRGFSDPEQFGRRIFNAHPYGVSRGQMYPVECALDVRQSRPEAAEHIGIWRYAKPDAVNYTLKALSLAHDMSGGVSK